MIDTTRRQQIILYPSDLEALNELINTDMDIFENYSTGQLVRYVIHNFQNTCKNTDLKLTIQRHKITERRKKYLANFIYNWRKEHNYSLKEMAKLLNVSDSSIYKWEHRYALPNVKHLQMIEEKCSLDLKKFLSEDELYGY